MPLNFHGKGVVVDPNAPEPPGTCDRCGGRFMLHDLYWQHDYRGNALVNLRIRVCDADLDEPDPYYWPQNLPPDPVPVIDPRPGYYAQQEDAPTRTVGPPPERVLGSIFTQLQPGGTAGRRYGSFTGR